MKIIEAHASDSERLTKFFSESVVPARIGIRSDRLSNFFVPYQIQSDSFKTFMLESDEGEVHGCASLVFRRGYINGKPEIIGFARDLRLSKNRKALTEWPQHFAEILKQEMKNFDCKYFFSVISKKERESFGALIRPKAVRSNLPRYYMLRQFSLIAIHGRIPFFAKPLNSIFVDRCAESEVEDLVRYLDEKAKERPLAPIFEIDSFRQQLAAWPNLSLADFIVARDVQGKIIGCCAPWSPSSIENLLVDQYGPVVNSARKVLTIGSWFGITRPLAKIGKPLLLTHLTHLFADNPDVFHSLICKAWETSPRKHTLVYPRFSGHYQNLLHSSFIHSRTPYAMYTVLPPKMKLPDFLRPRLQSAPPYFETSLI